MHLCGGEALLTGPAPEGQQRPLKRRQRNGASAQRSRRKHTDKADALHQQHESLEKHNRALRKEIQGLRAELAWWARTLHMHERLCLLGCAPCSAPVPPGSWGQAGRPLDPEPPRPQGCQEQPGLFQTPVPSPAAQQLPPPPPPDGSPGPLLASLPWLPPAQSASPSGSSSKIQAPSPHSSALPAPQQPPGPEPLSPSAARGLACLQDRERRPAFSAADQPGLAVDLGLHLLQAFPLLSSAQVHF